MDFWSILYIKTWFHGLYSTENTTINNKTLSETVYREYITCRTDASYSR